MSFPRFSALQIRRKAVPPCRPAIPRKPVPTATFFSLPEKVRERIYLMLLSPEYTAIQGPNDKYTRSREKGVMLDVDTPAKTESGRLRVENTSITRHRFHTSILLVNRRVHNEALSALKKNCCWVQVVVANKDFVEDLVNRGFPVTVPACFQILNRPHLKVTAAWKELVDLETYQNGQRIYLSQFCLKAFVRALWTASGIQDLHLYLETHHTFGDEQSERTLLTPFLELRGAKHILVRSWDRAIRCQLASRCITPYASAAEIYERTQEFKYVGDRLCAALKIATGANVYEEALVFLHDCKILYPAIFQDNFEQNGHSLYRRYRQSRINRYRDSKAKNDQEANESPKLTASQRKRAATLRQSIRSVFSSSFSSSELELPVQPSYSSISEPSSEFGCDKPTRKPPPPPRPDLYLTAAKLSLCFARAKNCLGDYSTALTVAKNALFTYEIPELIRNGLIAQLVLAHKNLHENLKATVRYRAWGTGPIDLQAEAAASDRDGLLEFKRWLLLEQKKHSNSGVKQILQEIEEVYLWG